MILIFFGNIHFIIYFSSIRFHKEYIDDLNVE